MKRWMKRIGFGMAILFVLAIVGFFVDRYFTERAGEKRLAAINELIDTNDPRWRYEEIDAERIPLPDERNSALLVPKFINALVSPRFDKHKVLEDHKNFEAEPNQWLRSEVYDAITDVTTKDAKALAIAASFKDYPQGQRHYVLTPDVISTQLPDVQDTRSIARLLDLQAERLTKEGRPAEALALIPAMINVERSLDNEPFMIAALVRIACLTIAVKRVERILGTTSSNVDLALVQKMLEEEAADDLFWYSLRAERGAMNVLFTNLRTGVLTFGNISQMGGGSSGSGFDTVLGQLIYRPHAANDHAVFLELITQVYEARKLPEHQQRDAMHQVELEIKNMPRVSFGTILTRLLTPAFSKIFDAAIRAKAHVRCAVIAVAVERYRQKHGRWPETLADLPNDIPAAIFLDPFDGQPLRYTKRPFSVTVYSVGLDETDDGGTITLGENPSTKGQDIGFQLFIPGQRGAEPKPKPKDPAPLDLPEPGAPDNVKP